MTLDAKKRDLLRAVKRAKMKAEKSHKPKPTIYPPDRPAEVTITKKRRRNRRVEQAALKTILAMSIDMSDECGGNEVERICRAALEQEVDGK